MKKLELIMAYVKAIVYYLQAKKTRHDILDFLRAIMIIGAVMAVIRVAMEMIR